MSYLALARKWRPRDFSSLVGQGSVIQALINSLDRNNLHHAYLFTGTRGVGKTTVGRILAKALNCQTGISSNPCNKCANCLATDVGTFPDLLEIDAASRTKVEDTRELLESIIYAPLAGRFKIYLIDEVHMLSTHSFNALLKTLEEPPEYVKFLLATTEVHKIPETILSRCLKFNLRNLVPDEIALALKDIVQQENYTIEMEALTLIADLACGSMRDALSILDQAMAFSNNAVINYLDVSQMLGVISKSKIVKLLNALVDNNAELMLTMFHEFSQAHIDYDYCLKLLQQQLHFIVMAHKTKYVVNDDVKALATKITAAAADAYYQLCVAGRKELPFAPNMQVAFEMALLRMIAVSSPVNPPAPEGGVIPEPDLAKWKRFIDRLNLSTMDKQIIENSNFNVEKGVLIITLNPELQVLLTDDRSERIKTAVIALSANKITAVKIIIAEHFDNQKTVALYNAKLKRAAKEQLLSDANHDPHIKNIMDNFNGKIVTE